MLSSNGLKLKGEKNPYQINLKYYFLVFFAETKTNPIHFAVRKVLCFIQNVLFQALATERKNPQRYKRLDSPQLLSFPSYPLTQ